MRRNFAVMLICFFVVAESASAQRPRMVRSSDPQYWFSAGIAGFSGNGVNDGASQSTWDFGNNSINLQYRVSLEKSLGNGTTFGIAGTYAHVPFVYSSTGVALGANETGAQCGQCDAHLDMASIVGLFRAGTGIGFHQVIELSGGIVAYENLHEDQTKVKLAPAGGNIDPIFAIGYGLGYGLDDRTQINFVPDYAIAIHERNGLTNGVGNTNSTRSLRLSVRFGFGGTAIRCR